MRKNLTSHMKQIARKLGLDEETEVDSFRQVLAKLISYHGSQRFAARALGIDESTLSRWCTELDIELRITRTTVAHTIAVLPEQEGQPA